MKIIALSGFSGSGKDTAADMIVSLKGYTKISLADPIKRFLVDAWDMDPFVLWGESSLRNMEDRRYPLFCGEGMPEMKESYSEDQQRAFLTPRRALQHVGTAGFRYLDNDVWTRYAINKAKLLLSTPGLDYSPERGVFKSLTTVTGVIIPDCRFSNELLQIKNAGGTLIRIKRPASLLPVKYQGHQSEMEMLSIRDEAFSIIINNDGSLLDLQNKIKELPI